VPSATCSFPKNAETTSWQQGVVQIERDLLSAFATDACLSSSGHLAGGREHRASGRDGRAERQVSKGPPLRNRPRFAAQTRWKALLIPI